MKNELKIPIETRIWKVYLLENKHTWTSLTARIANRPWTVYVSVFCGCSEVIHDFKAEGTSIFIRIDVE